MIIPENPNMPSSPRRNALSRNRGCKREPLEENREKGAGHKGRLRKDDSIHVLSRTGLLATKPPSLNNGVCTGLS